MVTLATPPLVGVAKTQPSSHTALWYTITYTHHCIRSHHPPRHICGFTKSCETMTTAQYVGALLYRSTRPSTKHSVAYKTKRGDKDEHFETLKTTGTVWIDEWVRRSNGDRYTVFKPTHGTLPWIAEPYQCHWSPICPVCHWIWSRCHSG